MRRPNTRSYTGREEVVDGVPEHVEEPGGGDGRDGHEEPGDEAHLEPVAQLRPSRVDDITRVQASQGTGGQGGARDRRRGARGARHRARARRARAPTSPSAIARSAAAARATVAGARGARRARGRAPRRPRRSRRGRARLVRARGRALGRLDVLVNNAAIFARTPFATTTPAQFDRFIAVNLRGAFFCAQAAARVMGRRGGRIVNIADVGAVRAWPGYIPYGDLQGGRGDADARASPSRSPRASRSTRWARASCCCPRAFPTPPAAARPRASRWARRPAGRRGRRRPLLRDLPGLHHGPDPLRRRRPRHDGARACGVSGPHLAPVRPSVRTEGLGGARRLLTGGALGRSPMARRKSAIDGKRIIGLCALLVADGGRRCRRSCGPGSTDRLVGQRAQPLGQRVVHLARDRCPAGRSARRSG